MHHHGSPERRQCIGADAVKPASEIGFSFRSGDPAEAHCQTKNSSQDQGHHAQFQAGGQALLNHGAHRLIVGEGVAQLPVQQIVQVVAVLHQEGLVQPQLLP